MSRMFSNASNFVSNATDTPNLSYVTDMSFMFLNALNFNSDVSDWNVSNVTNMSGMFGNTFSFNQSLGDWSLSDGVILTSILAGSSIDSQNYADTLNGWAALNLMPGSGIGEEIMGSIPSTYCDTAQAARDTLIANGWTITDLGPVACVIEEEEEEEEPASSGSSSTRVGERQKTVQKLKPVPQHPICSPSQMKARLKTSSQQSVSSTTTCI